MVEEDIDVISKSQQSQHSQHSLIKMPRAQYWSRPSDVTTSAGSLFNSDKPDSPSFDLSQAVDAQDAPMDVDEPTQSEDPDSTNREFFCLMTHPILIQLFPLF